MDTKQSLSELIAQAIAASFPQAENLPSAGDVAGFLEIPPEKEMGDYAFPCFSSAACFAWARHQIAAKLARSHRRGRPVTGQTDGRIPQLLPEPGEFRPPHAGRSVLAIRRPAQARAKKGRARPSAWISAPSTLPSASHIGHLSTTMIGQSLRRIFDFLGYKTVAINYLGDWGTQFGKLICAYKLWGDREEVERDGVEALTRLYVRFHEEAEGNPALEDEGRRWFKAIEDGDAEALELFNWFKALTLKDTQRVYDLLGVTFDSYNGEAFFSDKMGRVIGRLKAKNLLTVSDGASIVDLDEETTGMPPCLILKKDGATLYATRDIAAALAQGRIRPTSASTSWLSAGPALPPVVQGRGRWATNGARIWCTWPSA